MAAGKNILIIEDDKSMRDALTEAVKRKGYRAIAVGKPEEAASIVKILNSCKAAVVGCVIGQ